MRYFSCARCRSSDGSYNHEAIVARINADLAMSRHLAQRSAVDDRKQYEGVCPSLAPFSTRQGDPGAGRWHSSLHERRWRHRDHQALGLSVSKLFSGAGAWALAKTRSAGNVLIVRDR